MAFCRNCGAQVEDGAKFCQSCGASLTAPEPVPPTTPQPEQAPQRPAYEQQFYEQRQQDAHRQTPQPSYQQSQPQYAQSPAPHPEYQKLGGWLLFFTICWGLSAVSGLSTFAQGLGTLASVTTFGFGSRLFLPVVLSLLTSLGSIAVSVLMVVLIIQRNQMFLRLYQIVSIAELAISILAAVSIGFAASQYGTDLIGVSSAGGVGGIVGLVLMTMYFCKSVRVRTYMGSSDYLDMALFKIGV